MWRRLSRWLAHRWRYVRAHRVSLGAETDDALFQRLKEAVEALQGTIEGTDWALAGSQEIATWTIRLPAGEIEAVAETYAGLTLHGPEKLVTALAARVRRPPLQTPASNGEAMKG